MSRKTKPKFIAMSFTLEERAREILEAEQERTGKNRRPEADRFAQDRPGLVQVIAFPDHHFRFS